MSSSKIEPLRRARPALLFVCTCITIASTQQLESHSADDVAAGDFAQDAMEALAARSVYEAHAAQLRHLKARNRTLLFGSSSTEEKHPIRQWNDQLDAIMGEGYGSYYEFDTEFGEKIWSGQVEGRPGTWADSSTAFPLASASKLYTGFAAMRTMELKPKDWYPTRELHTFKGWEMCKDFSIYNSNEKAQITIHQLLTHSSGLPFGMRDSKSDICRMKLFYKPGTAFGYTLGHRVIGWLLRDYWKDQPETKNTIKCVNDAYKWLIFGPLGLSQKTKFSSSLTPAFGLSGEAGDAAIDSTGEDLMKLAVAALRKGSLPDGTVLISEANWNKWAIPNLLPGGKLSKDLVSWEAGASWVDWNVGDMKGKIMKQSGDYGWNYFGSTWKLQENGWCGFFSSCLRVSYKDNVAFVLMQRDVSDAKGSKKYLREHFDSLALSLQCTQKTCGKHASVFCQTCPQSGGKCTTEPWNTKCPSHSIRGKMMYSESHFSNAYRACYVPSCSISKGTDGPVSGATCGTFSNCDSKIGETVCGSGTGYKCECKNGYYSEGGKCIRYPTCRQATGGSCAVTGCDYSRGPTVCKDKQCKCKPGYCAIMGQCVAAGFDAQCLQQTGGTCSVLGCKSSRGQTDCVEGYCMCKPGYCLRDGTCVKVHISSSPGTRAEGVGGGPQLSKGLPDSMVSDAENSIMEEFGGKPAVKVSGSMDFQVSDAAAFLQDPTKAKEIVVSALGQLTGLKETSPETWKSRIGVTISHKLTPEGLGLGRRLADGMLAGYTINLLPEEQTAVQDKLNSATPTSVTTALQTAGSALSSLATFDAASLGSFVIEPVYPPTECEDINASTTSTCLDNLEWARTIGIVENPEWYASYGITADSSSADFQCALFEKTRNNISGDGHNCPMPCTSTLKPCLRVGTPLKDDPDVAASTNGQPSSSSFPWWVPALIGLLLVCLVLGIVYAYITMNNKSDKPKKKKRSVRTTSAATPAATPAAPEPAAPALAPAIAPVATVTTAMPVYQYQAPPVYVAQPAVANPAVTRSAPVLVASPAPATYTSATTYTTHNVVSTVRYY